MELLTNLVRLLGNRHNQNVFFRLCACILFVLVPFVIFMMSFQLKPHAVYSHAMTSFYSVCNQTVYLHAIPLFISVELNQRRRHSYLSEMRDRLFFSHLPKLSPSSTYKPLLMVNQEALVYQRFLQSIYIHHCLSNCSMFIKRMIVYFDDIGSEKKNI